MYSKRIKLDVTPGGEPQVIHVSQYDAGSRTFEFELCSPERDTEFEIPAGATAEIKGTKPDGNAFSYDVSIEDGAVIVPLTEQMAAVAGRVPSKITILKNDKKLLTEKFVFLVDRAAMDKDTVSSESELKEFATIMEDPSQIVTAAREATAAKTAALEAQTAAENARSEAVEAKNDAEDAKTAAESALATVNEKAAEVAGAADAVTESKQEALQAIVAAKENAVGVVNDKAQEVVNLKSRAEAIATEALTKSNNLENQFEDVSASNEQLRKAVTSTQLLMNQKVDGGYADAQGYLHLTANGNDVGSKIGPFAGGSGGGGGASGGNNAVFTARNATGWISTTISEGSSCEIKVQWSSIEEDLPTGRGKLLIYVGGAIKASLEVDQGTPAVDIKNYLSVGTNLVTFNIADIYGNNMTFNVSVDVEVLTISSTLDTSVRYEGPISVPYTPQGAISKTVYFYLDGSLHGTFTTSVSGRQLTYTIPQQPHGEHTIRIYFECEINNQIVRSNELYFEIMCVEELNNTPIITSNFNQTTVEQFTVLNIVYGVYTPNADTSPVSLYQDNTLENTLTVDRTQQTWSIRMDQAGNHTLKIRSGSQEKTFDLTVTESDIQIEAETDRLVLYLSSQGRSNSESHPEQWVSDAGETVSATLTGFDYTSDGWQLDEDGVTCLRVSGNARVQVPYKPFEVDARRDGLTIEIEYATRNVSNYNAAILSCMSGGRGLLITPQRATLTSEQTELSMQYKENEHIRMAYTIEKRAENRLARSFIDGTPARVARYPDDDDFSQVSPVGISIGSNDCTIDIYCIRVYTNNLTRHQVLDNWIADTQDGALMRERYLRNQIYDAYGRVVASKLPTDLPYMIIVAEELPQFKGDKKTVSGSYTDPLDASRSFAFNGCEIDRQGTSSAPYYRPNLDMKFKNGFEMERGGHADTFRLRENSVPTARFVGKANVASSEMANNTELVRLYNDVCPYKTPEMIADSRVRWGIDGYPIVIFWHDTTTDTVKFYGNYDFNFPKRFAEGYGYTA